MTIIICVYKNSSADNLINKFVNCKKSFKFLITVEVQQYTKKCSASCWSLDEEDERNTVHKIKKLLIKIRICSVKTKTMMTMKIMQEQRQTTDS